MNAEQKKRAVELVSEWNTHYPEYVGDRMAALLQELVDAPETEPVATVTGYYGGYLSIATIDGRVLPAGTALFTAPTQAEPPADVVRDAERYRWLRLCRATGEHWGGRWSLVIEGPCPDGDESSGAIDKAIDAARKRQGGGLVMTAMSEKGQS